MGPTSLTSMEDHQEVEKPVFEFRHKKLRSSRVLRNRKKKIRLGESMNHYEEISCYYVLRENPKKTQKSLLDHRSHKKRLIQCEECGKGFRYEKCLLNHREVMHSGESRTRSLFSFSDVQRRKRSKRVSRYKKISVSSSSSSSFTNLPVSEDDEEILEVAESLILLSKSGGKFLNGYKVVDEALRGFEDGQKLAGKFTDESLSNEQKLVRISTESDGTSKELLGF